MKQQIEELVKVHDSMVAVLGALPPLARIAYPKPFELGQACVHNLGVVIAQLEALSVDTK